MNSTQQDFRQAAWGASLSAIAECPVSTSNLTTISSLAIADASHLQGKRVGLVVLSGYPNDARPRRVADTFVQRGMSVDYICVSDGNAPARERSNGIEIFRVPIQHRRGGKLSYFYEYSAFILAASAILASRSLRHRYDLIYINNMPDVLVVSALFPKLLGAKVILDLHDPVPELMTTIFGIDPDSWSVRLIKRLEKWSMARAHQVLTVNIACQRIFSARSCPPEKVAVIMNSPDRTIFPFRAARSHDAAPRDRNRPFVVMYHGSLVQRNGVDLAVEAMSRLRDRLPNAQLHIYGKMTPYLGEVMRSVRERGLEQCVQHRGRKSLDEIVRAIDECDVGVIPNHRSSFSDINTPIRIFEYLSRGKPVIAPRTPGIQDYFNDGSLMFFEAGDADGLADKIAFAAAHPEETLNIAERGQEVYFAHSWEQEKQSLVSIVSRMLAGGRSR